MWQSYLPQINGIMTEHEADRVSWQSGSQPVIWVPSIECGVLVTIHSLNPQVHLLVWCAISCQHYPQRIIFLWHLHMLVITWKLASLLITSFPVPLPNPANKYLWCAASCKSYWPGSPTEPPNVLQFFTVLAGKIILSSIITVCIYLWNYCFCLLCFKAPQ